MAREMASVQESDETTAEVWQVNILKELQSGCEKFSKVKTGASVKFQLRMVGVHGEALYGRDSNKCNVEQQNLAFLVCVAR